jgi:hypothetical protein
MDNFGFIVTRHVNSEITNKYWNNCIKCLRICYPLKKIIIIDDNSNQEYVKSDYDYKNIEIINSEFPKRGELLPYYYYYKYNYFDNAVIIHDSVFFHKRVNFENIIKSNIKILPLWHFDADKENYINSLKISSKLKNSIDIQKKITMNELNILGLNQFKWFGCFGVQSFINHNFLCQIVNKYNLFSIMNNVNNRSDRCCLERIFGIIFYTESKNLYKIISLFGNIYKYQKWGYSYFDYLNDINKGILPKLVVKVWTGR